MKTERILMDKPTDPELEKAHRHFSASCFNRTWDYIDKSDRTPDDEQAMLAAALASLWHWSQRPDASAENQAVGTWQVARVFALLGEAPLARRYAMLSLEASQRQGVPPYCLAYAYEALARAESVAGDRASVEDWLRQAHAAAAHLDDEETRKMLLADLATIQTS
jgi:GNAT superfamily N-acetyltransferase